MAGSGLAATSSPFTYRSGALRPRSCTAPAHVSCSRRNRSRRGGYCCADTGGVDTLETSTLDSSPRPECDLSHTPKEQAPTGTEQDPLGHVYKSHALVHSTGAWRS